LKLGHDEAIPARLRETFNGIDHSGDLLKDCRRVQVMHPFPTCPNSLPLLPLDPSGLPLECRLVLVAAGPHVVVGVKDDLFAVGMPLAAGSSFGGRILIGMGEESGL